MEISADQKHMRTRDNPGKWSLAGVEPTTFSRLDASVPEFVPGQMFRSPPMADTMTIQSIETGEDPPKDFPAAGGRDDAVSQMVFRLEAMSIGGVSSTSDAVPSEGTSASVVDSPAYEDGKMEGAAVERLTASADDQHYGTSRCFDIV